MTHLLWPDDEAAIIQAVKEPLVSAGFRAVTVTMSELPFGYETQVGVSILVYVRSRKSPLTGTISLPRSMSLNRMRMMQIDLRQKAEKMLSAYGEGKFKEIGLTKSLKKLEGTERG